MKLTFGIIVLNGDFFLRQVLESIYPFAHAICIAEGSVKYWADKGITESTDDTHKILHEFPDPDKKIHVVHGTYHEKTEQCQAWFNLVPTDTDYVICNDADEVHTAENLDKLCTFLSAVKPTSVGFKSDSFYGGFDRIIGGFERDHSFKRVLKYEKGCTYRTHRQPTLNLNGKDIVAKDCRAEGEGRDVLGNELYAKTGITMWHGSYVSPKGVFEKLQYYEDAIIAKGKCIPNYFKDVFMQWVLYPEKRAEIEKKWLGVHEFMPSARQNQATYTEKFTGKHPDIIQHDMAELTEKFKKQIEMYK